jgi:hypothetical protein
MPARQAPRPRGQEAGWRARGQPQVQPPPAAAHTAPRAQPRGVPPLRTAAVAPWPPTSAPTRGRPPVGRACCAHPQPLAPSAAAHTPAARPLRVAASLGGQPPRRGWSRPAACASGPRCLHLGGSTHMGTVPPGQETGSAARRNTCPVAARPPAGRAPAGRAQSGGQGGLFRRGLRALLPPQAQTGGAATPPFLANRRAARLLARPPGVTPTPDHPAGGVSRERVTGCGATWPPDPGPADQEGSSVRRRIRTRCLCPQSQQRGPVASNTKPCGGPPLSLPAARARATTHRLTRLPPPGRPPCRADTLAAAATAGAAPSGRHHDGWLRLPATPRPAGNARGRRSRTQTQARTSAPR